ncbi:hypothetical protein J421_0238 [Gemmatirosa kalamazoonensis]|jgi:hypothetical protein|uniref:Uncharacterized protein n=1 Tax=Gemmatirosa kalamazoonensis TaxID=861299 RepID=W0RBT6_9BACT|nr:hypothetical protein [Gemmatirosa kalamazoonensis]AHG87775.1 hypothetical protein J421_0238 [Gemmatirosa kalamazoonensis]
MRDDAYDPYADDDGDDEAFGGGEHEGEGEAEGEAEGEPRPAVFVTTAQPVPVRVDRLTDERAPEGMALGAFIGDRLIARSAMDAESIERLLSLGLFDEPVPLGLFAYEEEPGLQCRLFALVRSDALREAADADEPWKASVPSFEDREEEGDGEAEGEGPPMETILLGHIVRFAGDRKHPDDLAAEAVDILQKILTGGPLADASQKAIDDLLDSL